MQDYFILQTINKAIETNKNVHETHSLWTTWNTVSGSETLLSSVFLKTETCSGVLHYITDNRRLRST